MIRFFSVVILVLTVLCFLAFIADRAGCDSRWSSYEHTYSATSGCMVRVNGLMTPEANVRFGQ